MATALQISRLREFIAQPDNVEPYTDAKLGVMIDTEGTPEAAAYRVWTTKAATASTLVDVTEGGSSRKLGSLQSNALSMAARFRPWVTDPTEVVTASAGTSIGSIVRE